VAGSSGAAAGVGGATAGVAGAAAGVGGAAGAGGRDAGNTAPAVDAAGDAIARDAGAADATPGTLRLESDGFLQRDGERIFPASACYPRDQSPPFRFVGVPATAKSLAFTFVDRSNGATKWVVWDIPPDTVILPANLSKTVHPSELPAASQRGSLGRTGYSGPGVAGPPLHTYDFTLFALDVAQLPGTDGASTVALRTTIIPRHLVAQSPIFTAKGQLGGSGE
jgi:Raf kinase inhibitor-like YbhB/YbcL family protein